MIVTGLSWVYIQESFQTSRYGDDDDNADDDDYMMRAWVGRWLPWSKPWGYYFGHHHVVSLLLLLPHCDGEDELENLRLESAKSLFLTFLTLAVVLSLKPGFRIHFHCWEELPCNWRALLREELSFLPNPRWLFSFYANGFIWEGR